MRKPRQSRLARAGTDQCIEVQVADAMLNGQEPSVLMSDGYKFSMGQAGAPLRIETFYLSFRRGTHYIPFDINLIIQELLPDFVHLTEHSFLDDNGYRMTDAMAHAICQDIKVAAAPPGTWVMEREPIAAVTGPSFLASWLEPLSIALNFPIQVATHAMLTGTAMHECSCASEARLVHLTLEAIEFNNTYTVAPQPEIYMDNVRRNAEKLVNVVGADRVFEVGMRGATCLEMHDLALTACKDAGITQTSNVWGAKQHGMTAVGTSGHEHQERWGADENGFRALRDMRPQTPGYLFGTYHAMKLGIPAAIKVMRERPDIAHSVRFDERDKLAEELAAFVAAEGEHDILPGYTFMDGISDKGATQIELLCETHGVTPDRGRYGSGGFLVCDPSPSKFTRNRVSAVYKLCQTNGQDVMKFATGKYSLPGKTVIFRSEDGKRSLVGPDWEHAPMGFHLLSCRDTVKPESTGHTPALDRIVKELWAKVEARIEEADASR